MNALVAIRTNAMGFLSPTPEQRDSVAQTLQAPAAAPAETASATTASTASTSAVANAAGTGNVRGGVGDELGKQAFLELLILQLQNQDPLAPVDNGQMLAQLAQFSALEAMTNLNENFALMSGNIDQLNFISAAQLLGKTVTGVDLNGELRTGLVESVHLDGSLVVLTVDGEFMTMAGIIAIETGPAADGGTEDDPGDDTGGGDSRGEGSGDEHYAFDPVL